MKIGLRFQYVDGDFDTSVDQLVCVHNQHYGTVDLCIKANMNIPFAMIRLHSSNLAVDADAVYPDAVRLGDEIVRRWNEANEKI
jgi:hypothetical protein